MSIIRRILQISSLLCTAIGYLDAAELLIPNLPATGWTPGVDVGVYGGIDQYRPGGANARTTLIDVTQAPYFADKTGATDTVARIQAAINAATAGQVVYLPRGTYRCDGTLFINANQDNITIRGEGMNLTTIDSRNGNKAIYAGGFSLNGPQLVTDGQTAGSTQITVANASDMQVGSVLFITVSDQTDNTAIRAGAYPVLGVGGVGGPSGSEGLQRQFVRITAKSGSQLTISPGLYEAYAGRTLSAQSLSAQLDKVGFEDFTINIGNSVNANQGQFGILVEAGNQCWIRNVKVTLGNNYAFHFTTSVQCELRHSFADRRSGISTNGAGLLHGAAFACLIEDNIFLGYFPNVEVTAGSAGNVFGYNFFWDSYGAAINSNHGPHNAYNLYEGNSATVIQCDGYFGSTSRDTVYRNHLHGTNPAGAGGHSVVLNRFTRDYNIVGNILGKTGGGLGLVSFGNPNLGNGMSDGTAQPTTGDFWQDWKLTGVLTTRTSDNAGIITLNSASTIFAGQLVSLFGPWGRQNFTATGRAGMTVTWSGGWGTNLPAQGSTVNVGTQPGGWQELDLDVEASSFLRGNYYVGGPGVTPAREAGLGAATLKPSLYRTTAPAFFGDLAWPPYNPASPNMSYEAIPAGYRFFHPDQEAPGVTPNSPPTPNRSPALTPISTSVR